MSINRPNTAIPGTLESKSASNILSGKFPAPRPQTSVIKQNNQNIIQYSLPKPYSSQTQSFSQQKRNMSFSHKRNSVSLVEQDFSQKKFSQHIGDEGERLDQEQLQIQQLINEMNKKRPQQQRIDKEKLYEEAIILNNELRKLQREQQQLSQKLIDVEEDKYKNQKMIMDVEEFIQNTKGVKINGTQSQLVLSLKKQYESLKEEIKTNNEEIEKTTKNPMFTKQTEFEIQLHTFKEQTENFREQLHQTKKQTRKLFLDIEKEKKKQNPGYTMKKLEKPRITEADVLQQEVYEQRAMLKILEYQNDLLISKKIIEERQVQDNLLQIKQFKEKLQRKEMVLESMHQDKNQLIENEKKKKQKQKELELKLQKEKTKEKEQQQQMHMTIKKFQPPLSDEKQQLQEKQAIIDNLQKKIQYLEDFLEERTSKENEQKKQMSNKISHLRQVIQNLEEKLDNLDGAIEDQLQHLPIEHMPRFGKGQYTEVFTITGDILHREQERQLKQAITVQKCDILIIVKELQYRLRIKQVPIEKALQRIIPDKLQIKGFGTVQDIQTILMKSPFSIFDAEDALLLSRYLIEDNQSDFAVLDMQTCQELEVIRSIFKNLLGNYQILNEEEEQSLFETIAKLLQKYGQGLQIQASLYPGYEEVGFLTPLQIKQVFDNVIEVPDHQLDYIMLRLFEYGNSYRQIEFSKLGEIFNTGGWQDKQGRKKLSKVLQLDDQKKYFHQMGDSDYNSTPPTKRRESVSPGFEIQKQPKKVMEVTPLATKNDKYFSSPKKKNASGLGF